MNNDLSYLRRRVSEEKTAAFRSPNKDIADIHRELAEAYEFRVFLLTRIATLNGADRTTLVAPAKGSDASPPAPVLSDLEIKTLAL